MRSTITSCVTAVLAVAIAACGSAAAPGPPQMAPRTAGPSPAATTVAALAGSLTSTGARSAIVARSDGGRISAAESPALGAGTPATRPWRIGSATKLFTATVVLQLAQDGRLRLDTLAGHYLPALGPAGQRITVRELLQHRSGLPDYTSYPSWLQMADASATIGPRDVLRFALSHPLLFPPGSRWAYSNTNYVALGLIVEAVTHHPFGTELTTQITRPLGLHGTLLPAARTVPGLRDDPGINPGVPWTAGGIVSTASDLSRFLSALLAGRLLGPTWLAQMERVMPTPLGFGYGLGIMAKNTPCGTALGHTGGTIDYATQAWATPDGRRVLIIFTRGTASSAGATAQPPLLCS